VAGSLAAADGSTEAGASEAGAVLALGAVEAPPLLHAATIRVIPMITAAPKRLLVMCLLFLRTGRASHADSTGLLSYTARRTVRRAAASALG
jgi:hypothetical protein